VWQALCQSCGYNVPGRDMMKDKRITNLFVLLILFVIVFIDSIGTTLILPLLEPLFLSKANAFSVHQPVMQNFYYGASLASFALAMFVGAPLLGDLSDKIGRKSTLLYCLIGTAFGYLISGYAIIIANPFLFLVGRIIDGFTAGSLSVAQAAITDIVPEDKRTKYFGYVLFCISISYIIGPLVSVALSNANILEIFDVKTPFWVTAILAIINIVILQLLFRERSDKKKGVVVDWFVGIKNIRRAFTCASIRKIIFIFLCLQLSWTYYFQLVSWFLNANFHANANMISINLSLIGLGMGISFCFFVGFLSRIIGDKKILVYGLIVLSIVFVGLLGSSTLYVFYGLSIVAGLSYGCLYPALLGILSKLADNSTQGLILGIAASVSAISAASTALIGSFLARYNMQLAIIVPLVFVLLGLIIMSCIYKSISSKLIENAG
jgi:MFS transporter, DHA1 family, tetracycline resistance protein